MDEVYNLRENVKMPEGAGARHGFDGSDANSDGQGLDSMLDSWRLCQADQANYPTSM